MLMMMIVDAAADGQQQNCYYLLPSPLRSPSSLISPSRVKILYYKILAEIIGNTF
jgi:hypothetical protein